jgi:hypothetical protein
VLRFHEQHHCVETQGSYSLIEALKSLGSIVGLLTGTFVLYEKLAYGRPVASHGVNKADGRKLTVLRVMNPGKHDVAILDIVVTPKIYAHAEDREVSSTVRAAAGAPQFFMLKPGESKELFLVPLYKDNVALELKRQGVAFSISWRRGNSTWLWQLPVRVRTTTQMLRRFGLDQAAY